MGDKIDEALREGYWTWKVARDGDGPNKMFPAEMRAALAAAGLAIAETRERAEDQHKRTCEQLFEAQERVKILEDAEGIRWARMNARIAELDQEWEKSVQIAGAANAKVKKLEAENARLRKRLAIFQRNAGLATTGATS